MWYLVKVTIYLPPFHVMWLQRTFPIGLLIYVLISICIRELSHIVCIEDLCENYSLLWSLDISELAVSSLYFYTW